MASRLSTGLWVLDALLAAGRWCPLCRYTTLPYFTSRLAAPLHLILRFYPSLLLNPKSRALDRTRHCFSRLLYA